MKHLERLEDRHQKYLESCANISRFPGLKEERVALGDLISLSRVNIEGHLAANVPSKIPDLPKQSITQHRSKLSIDVPDFNGEPLQWATFLKLFSHLVHKEDLSKEEKLHLLIKAMKNNDAEHIAKTTAANTFSYNEVVKVFRTKYDRPRPNFSLHMKNLVQKRKTIYTFNSMEDLCVSIQQLLGGLETCHGLSATHLIAYFMEDSFTERLKHEWEVFSVDIVDPPTTEEILEFLKKRMANLSISTKSSSASHPFAVSHPKPASVIGQAQRQRLQD